MPDDSKRATIEVYLPRPLLQRVRSLESEREYTPGSIVRDSLERYFASRANAPQARELS